MASLGKLSNSCLCKLSPFSFFFAYLDFLSIPVLVLGRGAKSEPRKKKLKKQINNNKNKTQKSAN